MNSIRQVMTANPACAPRDASLQEVARMMAEQDTGFIPVHDQNQLFGVITDRDLVLRAFARGVEPEKARVGDFCTREVICLQADESIERAIEQMERYRVRRLPILEQGRLIGVVSLGDLAEYQPDKAEEVLVEVSKSQKTLAHGRA